MRRARIIPYKVWINEVTGATASVFGAVPGFGNERKQWHLAEKGFTTDNLDGTYGLGRMPFATREGLEAHLKAGGWEVVP